MNNSHISIATGGLFLFLDQALKYAARENRAVSWYAWKPYFGWEYFENTGIALSLPFPNWILIIVTPFIIFALIMLYIKQKERLAILGFSYIIAGAISNYIDRVLFGVTIDYIRILTGVINLADILIITGALFLVSHEVRLGRERKNKIQSS